MTVKSVGAAAAEMCMEADRQIRDFNDNGVPIDSDRCIEISTK